MTLHFVRLKYQFCILNYRDMRHGSFARTYFLPVPARLAAGGFTASAISMQQHF
jgi:hypothetical protein